MWLSSIVLFSTPLLSQPTPSPDLLPDSGTRFEPEATDEFERGDENLQTALYRDSQRRKQVLRHLGLDRYRRLGEAQLHLSDPSRGRVSQLDLDPLLKEDIEDLMLDTFLKLSRESVEQRLQIEARLAQSLPLLERAEARATRRNAQHRGPRLVLSPRFDIRHRATVGVKMRLKGLPAGSSRVFLNTSFQLRHGLGGNDLTLKLAYRDGNRDFFLIHQTDHHHKGQSTTFGVRMGF